MAQGARSSQAIELEPGPETVPPSDASAPMPGLDSLQALASERIAIEAVSIEVDGGRFPSKAVAGHPFRITADIFGDGHEGICAAVRFGKSGSDEAQEVPLTPEINDLWSGEITLDENAFYDVTILAWRDLYGTWAHDVAKKHAAGQDISLELIEARQLIETAIDPSNPASAEDKSALRALLGQDEASGSADARLSVLTSPTTLATMRRAAPRANLTAYKTLKVFADRERAAFSAWYELMPRSQSGDVNRHGTFDDVIARLPYVRDLGFDVLYFPPIHPIGRTNRKGRNNTLTPGPDDPGSPYAIGASEGGHDAIHPELGDFESFKRLVDAAHAHGLEIALDFAIQCSPDHPWIKEHPEWFDWRPDGSIKFAENPPKKYEDIVNVHFYRGALPDLWYALRDIVLFWIGHGVKIFRVDNPHTKPFPFWEWMIGEIRAEYPETIFLAEAFTRPKLMKRLAKVGFNQSYSYFTWRNDRWGLTEYLTELTQEPCREYMRPNFFVNTPDINPHYLQTSGRPGFQIRLCLAASLGGNYGVYNGFEICEAAPFPGKEEYLDSEKYEIRAWDMDQPGHIQDDIRLMNRLRQQHPALRDFLNVGFYQTSNDQILSYSKKTRDLSDFLLFHVNLDPHNTQFLSFEVPLWEFGLPDDAGILVRDAIHGNTFTWYGKPQTLELNPHTRPYTIWQLFAPGTGPS